MRLQADFKKLISIQ